MIPSPQYVRELAEQRRYDEALAVAEEAVRAARPVGGSPFAEALETLARVHGLVGDYPRALNGYLEAARIRQEMGDSSSAALDWLDIARVRRTRNELVEALRACENAVALSRTAEALRQAGTLHELLGQYDSSLAAYEECFALRRQAGDLAAVGAIRTDLGDFQRASRDLENALKLSRDSGDRRAVAVSSGFLGGLLLELADYERCERRLREALAIVQEVGGPWTQAIALLRLGRLFAESDRAAEAENAFREGVAVSRTLETPTFLGRTFRCRARLRLHDPRGKFDALEALELARGVGNPFESAMAMTALARFEPKERALQLVAQARVLMPSDANLLAVLTCLEDEAAVRLSAGDRDGAIARAREGIGLAIAKGAKHAERRLRLVSGEHA